ncbi:MAG: nuclear transport factor 2 family protein [Bacteroidota bacterium]
MNNFLYLATAFILCTSCQAQSESTSESPLPPEAASKSELYKTIATMDSLYFAAQNACDLEAYASYLTEDFEFFHDVAGFTPSKEKE